jgi:prepilin-type N-terminal cleavage/methylation domain-containing protein
MSRHGLTIVELVVAIAVLGVLLGIGFLVLPTDRTELNQAAQRFERDIQRARFNAISANSTVDFEVAADGSGYAATVRGDPSSRWNFGVQWAEAFPNVRTAVRVEPEGVPASAGRWSFDARGVGFSEGDTPMAITVMRFTHLRTGAWVELSVNRYGVVVDRS